MALHTEICKFFGVWGLIHPPGEKKGNELIGENQPDSSWCWNLVIGDACRFSRAWISLLESVKMLSSMLRFHVDGKWPMYVLEASNLGV